MKMVVEFSVAVKPMAQPRVKARSFCGHATVYTPKKKEVASYKDLFKQAYLENVGGFKVDIEESSTYEISLDVEFQFSRGPLWMRKSLPSFGLNHKIKPDLDNLEKAVMDALTGVAWRDDSEVVAKSGRKYFADVSTQEDTSSKRKKTVRVSGPDLVKVRITYEKEDETALPEQV